MVALVQRIPTDLPQDFLLVSCKHDCVQNRQFCHRTQFSSLNNLSPHLLPLPDILDLLCRVFQGYET